MNITIIIQDLSKTINIADPLSNEAGSISVNEGTAALDIKVIAGHKKMGITKYIGDPDMKMHEGMRLATFRTNKHNQNAGIILDDKPEISALIDNYIDIKSAIDAARNTLRSEINARLQAVDEIELVKMHEEERRLIALIPSANSQCRVEIVTSAFDYEFYHYYIGDVEIPTEEIEIHGNAYAIRPGALGAFSSVIVASVPTDKINGIREAIVAKKLAAEDEKQRKAEERAVKEAARIAERGGYTCTGTYLRSIEGEDGSEQVYKLICTHPEKPTVTFKARNIFDYGLGLWFEGRNGIASKTETGWILLNPDEGDDGKISQTDAEAYCAARDYAVSRGLASIHM